MRYENKLGGTFEPGRPISFGCRKRILNLYQTGYNASQISQRTCVTKPCVIKLIKQYNTWGSMKPFQKSGKLPQKTTDEVLAFIELQVRLKPSIYGREIRRKLINIGEFTNSDAPSVSWINKVIHNKLNMTSKGISELPKEAYREENTRKADDYLDIISRIDPAKLHFFDESSVIRTTGNRPRGRSEKGKPGI